MASKREIMFSADIEANGQIPIRNSMWSLGTVAFLDGKPIAEFYEVLEDLPGSTADPDTMDWWKKFPEAFAQARENPKPAKAVMRRFVNWVETLCEAHEADAAFMASPAGYDFTFVYVYCHLLVGRCPFRHRALDMRSYAMATFGRTYHGSGKENMPARCVDKTLIHNHIAVDDALEQGVMMQKIMDEARITRELAGLLRNSHGAIRKDLPGPLYAKAVLINGV